MKPVVKKAALYVNLSNQLDYLEEPSGNYSTYKLVTDNGNPKLLRFVIRSNKDVDNNRIKAYDVLVP